MKVPALHLYRVGVRIGALFRILIGQFVKREVAAIHDLERAGERVRIAGEQAVHLVGRFQVAVRMPLTAVAEFVDGDVVAVAAISVKRIAPK